MSSAFSRRARWRTSASQPRHAPQYLIFSDEQYQMLGSRIKCNPAIKRPTDRDDLRFALSHDVIDTIATDHAPHILAEKQGTALTAASGMPSVQWALPVMMQTVAEGVVFAPYHRLKDVYGPALLYGIEGRGALVEVTRPIWCYSTPMPSRGASPMKRA